MYHNQGELVAQLRGVEERVRNNTQPTQYCIVSGNSGCGKSSLINLLMGIPLTFQKDKQKRYELKQEGDIEGPPIRNHATHYYQDISIYPSKNTTFIDMPSLKTDEKMIVNL